MNFAADSSNAKEPFRIDTFAPKDAADFKTLANAVVERCGQFKAQKLLFSSMSACPVKDDVITNLVI